MFLYFKKLHNLFCLENDFQRVFVGLVDEISSFLIFDRFRVRFLRYKKLAQFDYVFHFVFVSYFQAFVLFSRFDLHLLFKDAETRLSRLIMFVNNKSMRTLREFIMENRQNAKIGKDKTELLSSAATEKRIRPRLTVIGDRRYHYKVPFVFDFRYYAKLFTSLTVTRRVSIKILTEQK